MQEHDWRALQDAAYRLEKISLTTRISQIIGIPIEKALAALPGQWSSVVTRTTKTALEKSLDGALLTLNGQKKHPSTRTHKFLAGLSGAFGGSLGAAALAVELPLSATIMLRSIADIARSEGEQLEELATQQACLEVFALSGGTSSPSEAADTSYYAVRSLLTKSLGDASRHLVSKGLAKEGAPAMVRLINIVASRFSIPVSQKLAAQSLPAIGAVGGAAINLVFIDHFQAMARAHFTVRRLERSYGAGEVESHYQAIVRQM